MDKDPHKDRLKAVDEWRQKAITDRYNHHIRCREKTVDGYYHAAGRIGQWMVAIPSGTLALSM